MPGSTPKSLNCPTCGAPLDYDGSRAVVRCGFCRNVVVLDALKSKPAETIDMQVHSRIPDDIVQLIRSGNKLEAIKRYREHFDVSLARAKYAVEQIEAGYLFEPEAGFPAKQAEIAVKTAAVTATAATAAGTSLGCIITVVVLLIVGGIIGLVMIQPGGPVVARMIAMQEAVILPAAPDAPADVVAHFYNVNDETRVIGRVNYSDSKLSWKTEPLPGEGYVDAMVTDGERLYVASDMDLFAFNAADGSVFWRITLPDKLDSGEDNLVVQNGMVIVMTMDRSIQAYEAGTGTKVWSRPLLSYARGLRMMGNRLVILDYAEGVYDFSIYLIDPKDGSQDHVIFPVCVSDNSWEETVEDDSGILYDSAADDLYLVFGTSFGCVQRYDLGTGRMVWEVKSEDSFDTSFYGFNYYQSTDTIYFASEARLFTLDKQAGDLKLLFENESYEMSPLALRDGTLLVLAKRTKGSQRFELWGLNSSSGERTWQMVPENAGPVDPPYAMSGLVDKDESGWTWRLTSVGLLLIKFQAEPNQLLLTTYDLANGTSLSEQVVPMKDVVGDFYSVPVVLGWRANLVYFILDSRIYALDATTGELMLDYQ